MSITLHPSVCSELVIRQITFGTVFGDRGNGIPAGQILYAAQSDHLLFVLDYAKEQDNSYSAISSTT